MYVVMFKYFRCRDGYHFCRRMALVYELAYTGEEEKKKMIFNFFKRCFLDFYKAELKSEDIFVIWRVRAFSRYPFSML